MFELYDNKLIKNFMLAGNSTLTVVSKKSNKHLTFKALKAKKGSVKPFFVSVLTGSDNEHSYEYIGNFWENEKHLSFVKSKKTRISEDAVSLKTIKWIVNMINNDKELTEQCTIYRDNRCGRCGRKLTNPQSIVTGIGPECQKKI